MSTASGWTVRRLGGTVEHLHGLSPEPDADREVWLMSPQDTALVLGSAQPEDAASPTAAGEFTLVRRRSGGGAVLVVPDSSVWIDVVIGPSDPLWDEDVNRAPLWLGEAWAEALASLGLPSGEVFRRYEPGRWGRLACFASRGPGEVLIDGAKAVGVTQRRTRTTARFQTLAYRQWDSVEQFAALAESSEQLRAALESAVWPIEAGAEEIRAAFVACLPR